MIYDVPSEFQAKVDEFNLSQGGPARVETAWNPKTSRWEVWAIPVDHSSHPLGKKDTVLKLLRDFPDHSGRRGVKLFVWCKRDDKGRDTGFVQLDDRIFETLRWADSFRSKDAFQRVVEEPQMRKDLALKRRIRDIAYGAREYWWGLDNLIVSMNPEVRSGADWRTAKGGWR